MTRDPRVPVLPVEGSVDDPRMIAQAGRPVMGWEFGERLCQEYGIDPDRVLRIVVTIDPGLPVQVVVTFMGGDELGVVAQRFNLVPAEDV